jgi:hypothetical protein
MKQLQKSLQSVVKTLNALAKKLDAISIKLDAPAKPGPKPKAVKKAAPKKVVKKSAPKKVVKKSAPKKVVKKSAPKKAAAPTAAQTILKIIGRNKKGLNTAALIGKSGFNAKKVQNTVFRLKKQGIIVTPKKGVYVKA